MNNPVVYDKAKYHRESVELAGLDEVQAEVHTAFFLGWLIDNNLISDEMRDECGELLAEYKSRKKTAIDVYGWWDCCLVDDMLSDEGNAFAQAYFDFTNGQYLTDYADLLVQDLPSEFHVPYTWENYEIIRRQIDRRYSDWRQTQRGG
jgi:hypothetical protein